MQLAILLMQKIGEYFIYLAMGFAMVKLHVLKSEDTVPFSKISLYLMTPCVLIMSFQVKLTAEVRGSIFLSLGLAVLIHVVNLAAGTGYAKLTRGGVVDATSIIYTNCVNLVYPLVSYVLGPEYLIYCGPYAAVCNFLVWSHGVTSFSGQKADLRKIARNVNILSIIAGFILMLLNVRITGIPASCLNTIGGMLGPLSMVITGMILAGMDLKQLFGNRRLYGVLAMRMVVCPVLIMLIFALIGVGRFKPVWQDVAMVSFFSAMAPSAAVMNQFAILYNKDARYASAINIVTTLSSILFMPLMLMLYEVIV